METFDQPAAFFISPKPDTGIPSSTESIPLPYREFGPFASLVLPNPLERDVSLVNVSVLTTGECGENPSTQLEVTIPEFHVTAKREDGVVASDLMLTGLAIAEGHLEKLLVDVREQIASRRLSA